MAAGLIVQGAKALQRHVDRSERRLRPVIRKNLRESAKIVQKAGKREIGRRISNRRTRRRRDAGANRAGRKGHGTGTGKRLGTFSGRLRRSIKVRVRVRRAFDFRAEIGPRGFPMELYGRIHEQGLGKYPKRPFMSRASRKTERAVYARIGRTLRVVA